MKKLLLVSLISTGVALGLASGNLLAQQAPQTIQITGITGSQNNQQLTFTKYSGAAPLTEVELILNLTSISFNAQIDGTGGTPDFSLDDVLGLQNNQPPNLVNTVSYTAPGTLTQNTQGNYSVTDTMPLDTTSSIILTSNLVNFTQSNFSDSVMNQLNFDSITGGTFDSTSDVTVTGSVEIIYNPQAAPEPASWALAFLGIGLFAYLRRTVLGWL